MLVGRKLWKTLVPSPSRSRTITNTSRRPVPLSSQQKPSLDGDSTTSLNILLGSTRLRSVYSHSYVGRFKLSNNLGQREKELFHSLNLMSTLTIPAETRISSYSLSLRSAQRLTLEHFRSLQAVILKGLSVVTACYQPRIHSQAVQPLLFWEEEKGKSQRPSFVFDKVKGKHVTHVWVKWLPIYQTKELKG